MIKLIYLPLFIIEGTLALIEGLLGILSGILAIFRVWVMRDYSYLKWLERDLADCETILELGCGSNSPLLKIGLGKKTVAIDIWQPYVDMHNDKGDYADCWKADILKLGIAHKYDAVVLCDVLEHLPRPEVRNSGLFDIIEAAARKKVILFTPNGFIENDEVDGDPYQAHVSAWEPEDYLKRGYTVKGATGIRYILGKASLPKYHPYSIMAIIAMLSQPIIFNHPKIAWHSYAVKETDRC